MTATMTPLDERDTAMMYERRDARYLLDGPVCGDWVRFSDGIERRISHVWDWDGADGLTSGVQTSAESGIFGGRWHLTGSGNGNFSGGLYPITPMSALTATEEEKPARFWFFHHDHWRAHNGVEVIIPVRVWEASCPANT